MPVLIAYLLKSAVCSVVLYAYYYTFLRNRPCHRFNRFFLLIATIFSLILPLVDIRIEIASFTTGTSFIPSLDVVTSNYFELDAAGQQDANARKASMWPNYLTLIYCIICLVMLFRLSRSVIYLLQLRNKYRYELIDGIRVYDTVEPSAPFSFFKNIFWNRIINRGDEAGMKIYRHELYHVQEFHSADVIFLEAVSAIFWFNPIYHLVKRECKEIHEFLADRYVIQKDDHISYAEVLLQQAITARRSGLSHFFFQNNIKRRINMITTKSTRKALWSRMMVVPVTLILFACLCFRTQPGSSKPGSSMDKAYKEPMRVVVDAGHGGSDNGAFSNDGSVREKDLTLAIALKLKEISKGTNVEVILTRNDDSYPGLKERPVIAANSKADAFVSIHIGAVSAVDNNGLKSANSTSGIDVFIPSTNTAQLEKSKLLGSAMIQSLGDVYNFNKAQLQQAKKVYVLEHAPCAAVLIECGYLTSDKDLKFISTSANQEKLAKKILEALELYHQTSNLHESGTAVTH